MGAIEYDQPSVPIKGRRILRPMSIFDIEQLTEAFNRNNIKLKHINTIHRYIIQQGATSFDDIPEIPKAARAFLDKDFVFSTSKVVERNDAKDGSTTKMLVELQDGQRIETVIMRYGNVELSSFPQEEKERRAKELEEAGRSFKSNKRATVCISSQVGCAMGCTFCATGTMGLLSNLTTGEIIEQLVHANQIERIRNVVFMGMGEPLDNYSSVLSAINMMLDTARFGLSPSRITISTVGVVPRIRDLMKDLPQIGLALSLHAPTQDLRVQIVPTAKAWHIDRIMEVTRDFIRAQNAEIKSGRRHILIEYVLIADVNDSPLVAQQLGELLSNMDVLLNVIPYNVTEVPHDYKTPSQDTLKEFLRIVREYGVHTLVRQELGSDIASACGQLVIKRNEESNGGCSNPVKDLEDLGGGPKSKSATPKRTRHKKGKLTVSTPKTDERLQQLITYGSSALALLHDDRMTASSLPVEVLARILSYTAATLGQFISLSRQLRSLVATSVIAEFVLLKNGRRGAFLHMSDLLMLREAEAIVQLLIRKRCSVRCVDITRGNFAFKGSSTNLIVHDLGECPFIALSRPRKGCPLTEDTLVRIAEMILGCHPQALNHFQRMDPMTVLFDNIMESGFGKLFTLLSSHLLCVEADGEILPLVRKALERNLFPVIQSESRRLKRRWGCLNILNSAIRSRDTLFLSEYLEYPLDGCNFVFDAAVEYRNPVEVAIESCNFNALKILLDHNFQLPDNPEVVLGPPDLYKLLYFECRWKLTASHLLAIIPTASCETIAYLATEDFGIDFPFQIAFLKSLYFGRSDWIRHSLTLFSERFPFELLEDYLLEAVVVCLSYKQAAPPTYVDSIRAILESLKTENDAFEVPQAVMVLACQPDMPPELLNLFVEYNGAPISPRSLLAPFCKEFESLFFDFEPSWELLYFATLRGYERLVARYLNDYGIDSWIVAAAVWSNSFNVIHMVTEACRDEWPEIVAKFDTVNPKKKKKKSKNLIVVDILPKNAATEDEMFNPNREKVAPSPLFEAISRGNPDIVTLLLELNFPADKANAYFVRTAILNGNEEIVRLLIHEGFSVNPTCLDAAVSKCHAEIIQILISETPLEPIQSHLSAVLAGFGGDSVAAECVRILIQSSTHRRRLIVPRDLVISCVQQNRTDVVAVLIKESDPELVIRLEDALLIACRNGNFDLVGVLLARGVRPRTFFGSGGKGVGGIGAGGNNAGFLLRSDAQSWEFGTFPPPAACMNSSTFRVEDLVPNERVGMALVKAGAVRMDFGALEGFSKMGYARLVKAMLRRCPRIQREHVPATLAGAANRVVLDMLLDAVFGEHEGWEVDGEYEEWRKGFRVPWRQFALNCGNLEVGRRLLRDGLVELPRYEPVAMPFLNGHVVVARAYDELLFGS
ncbi:sorting nexin [Phlyctochytrium planicorne]|nr:sorting nexin [Phlyctochytrium planicorne]